MSYFSTPAIAANLSQSLIGDPKNLGRQKAEQTAKEFESMFLTQMLNEMTRELKPDANFGGGQGEQAYRSFLNTEYANAITNAGGIGLADTVLAQIIRMQGESPAPPAHS